MQEILCKQSKETRCYIMSALMFFEGFKELDGISETRGKMSLDVLGLSKTDIESFPMPDYSEIVSHLSPISDSEVRHWIISNTYSPVLRSRRRDALKAFRTFCSDLGWNVNEIKETTELIEEIEDIKPIDNGVTNASSIGNDTKGSGLGCFGVIALVIACSLLCSFLLI